MGGREILKLYQILPKFSIKINATDNPIPKTVYIINKLDNEIIRFNIS